MEILTEEYKGYTITIERDQEPMSPDDVGWGENAVFMATHHRQFHIKAHKSITEGINYKQWWKLPLYGYIHSGVALSLDNSMYPFNDPWDACQVGNVFVKKSKNKTPTREKAEEVAQGYVDAWNQYLGEDVWGYVITDALGEHIESCWGFYTSEPTSVMEEARETVDALKGDEESADTVVCKFCEKNVLALTAHLHQGTWVGDDCCWDERLRVTE